MVRGEDPAVLGEALPIDRYAEIAAVPFYGNTKRPQPVTATVANTPAAAPAARHRVDGWP